MPCANSDWPEIELRIEVRQEGVRYSTRAVLSKADTAIGVMVADCIIDMAGLNGELARGAASHRAQLAERPATRLVDVRHD